MRVSKKTLFLVAVISAGLLACDDDDDFDDDFDDLAAVRVVHAAPGAPAVDVFADDVLLVADLAYGDASPFVDLEEGTYNIQIRAAGTPTVVFETGALELLEGDQLTAVAAGDVASTDPASSFRVIPLFADFGATGDAEARVRIVHASPDAPAVDIDVGDDGVIEIPELARFSETGDEGVVLPAGEQLQLGIDAGGQPVTAFTTPALPREGELFVIATGRVADLPRTATGFSLLVVGPEGVITNILQNPTVYALHASPDAPAVDIRADVAGPNLFSALAFGELAPVQVPPGDYTLTFFAAGDTTPVASAAVTGLAAGERYLAVATGFLTPIDATEQRFQVLVYREEHALDAMPRLRAIHASPDAPAVDISTATGGMLDQPIRFRNVVFGEATDPAGLVVPAAPSVRIGIAPAGSTVAAATFNLDTTGATRDFVVAAGAFSPSAGEQGFRLFVVDTTTSPWMLTTVLPD
jgi:hypothetical protein